MADNNHDGMKKCTKCGIEYPATVEFFNRDKTRKDGLKSWCRVCVREYYQENKDSYREHYQENKDRILEYNREYRQKNKDSILENNREYYQKNKDRKREYIREYYEKNKDRRREYSREYQQTPVGRLVESIYYLRQKTGATIYVRDMTEEQKEVLANQYVAVITLEKTEKELLAASGKKRCSKCGDVFDYEMFYKREDGRYKSRCKACTAKYHQKNKDKIKDYQRKYRQQNKKST